MKINPSHTHSGWPSVLFLLMALYLTACSGPAETPVVETSTATVTATATETIVWFPATSTSTMVPTRQPEPTENLHPGVGDILYKDDFSDHTLWTTKNGGGGNITYSTNVLTLASQDAKTYLASLYSSEDISSGSVEITSNVTLCKGEDSYGLLVRASNTMTGYRFLVNCQGQTRLEILRSGKPSMLVDWMQSGQVLPGCPFQLRLRVWMVKDELRFFLNDVFQFSVRDGTFKSGKIGIFTRQAADTPLTVSYTNLVIRSVDSGYVLPKATPKPTATRKGQYQLLNTPVPKAKP